MANLKVKPEEAKEEAAKIVKYPAETLLPAIREAWNHMSELLQKAWVGVDEYNFELVFADKVNNLYNTAFNLVYGTAQFLEGIAQSSVAAANERKIVTENGTTQYATVEFQPWGYKGNDFESTGRAVDVSENNPNKNTPNQEIDGSTHADVSMKIGNFVEKIQNAVTSFKDVSKWKIQECLGGDWDESLVQYFNAVENAMKDILTAYQDIKNSSEELLTTVVENYTKAISKKAADDEQELTSTLETKLAGSKWVS